MPDIRAVQDWLPPLDREDLIRTRRIPVTHWVWIATTTLVAGTFLVVSLILDPPTRAVLAAPAPMLLAAVMILLGELSGVTVARRDDTTTQANLSMAVAVALVASGPLSFLLAVQGIAVITDDIRHRRAPFKVAFNLSQYTIALVAARGVYCLLTGEKILQGPTAIDEHSVFPMLVAGVVYVLVNELQVSVTASLITGEPALAPLLNDVRMTVQMTMVLVGTAPVVGYLLYNAWWLTPFLLLPALAVAYSSQVAAHRHRVSLQDPLTGLANRTMFNRRLERALAEAALDDGPQVAVLLVDVDHFKDVNDVLGHHTGDLLLLELASRAAVMAHTEDTVARLGGDEFALLLRGADVEQRATEVAERLLAELNEPLDLNGSRLFIQCSVGVVVVNEPGISAVEVVKRADIALYDAKQERSCYSVYTDESSDAGSAIRLSLLADLRDALAADALDVRFQPMVDGATGRLVGVEALCRWHHPVHGWLSPSLFIPLAESAGLIGELTELVLMKALQACREWDLAGLDVRVSVNLSTRLVSDASLPDLVRAAVLETQVAPERLTIEVTESGVVTDPSRAMVVLGELRRLGVRLAMDDFGTGYSSLALLQHLDMDELKVDRSFVKSVDTVAADAILVRSTVDLAHSLGLGVVAEGVESEVIAGILREMGCDQLQGYLFGASMTKDEITQLARSFRHRPARPTVVDLTDGHGNGATMRAPSTRVVRLPSPRSRTLVR